jgi:hypothetical protein
MEFQEKGWVSGGEPLERPGPDAGSCVPVKEEEDNTKLVSRLSLLKSEIAFVGFCLL